MTTDQEHIVYSTWRYVYPLRSFVSELFYLVLFKVDPGSRAALSGDSRGREERFLEVLDALVGQIGHPRGDRPEPGGTSCATRVRLLLDSHRIAARIALLRVLHQSLGDRYTAPVEEAWLAAFERATTTFGSTRAPVRAGGAATKTANNAAARVSSTASGPVDVRNSRRTMPTEASARPRYPVARRPSGKGFEVGGTS